MTEEKQRKSTIVTEAICFHWGKKWGVLSSSHKEKE